MSLPSGEELRRITAHHEAGHAVATYVRGGTVDSITIMPTATLLGETLTSPKSWTATAFAIHAGPWAEARVQWQLSTFDLDDNYHSRLFEDKLHQAWMLNLDGDGDLMKMATAQEELEGLQIVHNYRTDQWNKELEAYSPAIQEVAALLLQGDTLAQAEVAEIIDRLDPGAREGH
jgi:hypothetical protein